MKDMQCLRINLLCHIPIISCMIVGACLGQPPKQSVVLNYPVDRTTAVSFFYFGDLESHWREPMNIYVTDAGDPRLHTVFFDHGPASKGVATWITAQKCERCSRSLHSRTWNGWTQRRSSLSNRGRND